nr:hypothetical protein [Tanacetum cinerariifolium]
MNVHDNDASKSSQPSWGKMCTSVEENIDSNTTVGKNSLNITNTFSAAGPSNTAVSPTYGKSSSIDTSQLPEDPNMPELEDITYSDDEDVGGAEADFNNLESSIPVKQKKDGIFISQDKYVAEILRKFGLTEGKSASTPIDTEKPLLKDPDGEDVDVHTYSAVSIKLDITLNSTDSPLLGVNTPRKGVDCLPNEEIFAELARMGYEKPSTKLTFYKAFFSSQWKFLIHTILQSMSAKRISWNEFSLAMASAVICLSTGRKFSFSKYIFDRLARNVDSTSKFYMYPRFIQLLIKKQLGKGFSGIETPLFEGMIVEQVIKEGGAEEEHVEEDTAAQGDDTTRIDALEDTMMDDASNQGRMINDLDKDNVVALMDDKEEEKKEEEAKVGEVDQEDEPAKVHEVVEVVTTAKLIIEVFTAASETITAATTTVSTAELQVPAATITAAPVRVAAASTRRRKGVVIKDPKEESSRVIHADTKSKDKGKGIMDVTIDHVKKKAKEDPAVQRYQVIKKRPQTEAQAQKNMIIYLKNVAGFRLDYFKGMSYDDIRPIFEAKFNSNIEFLLKTKEQMKEEEKRALQSINETPAQKVAKRRKLNEEVEDLKIHLEIVLDEDDDVYTGWTSLSMEESKDYTWSSKGMNLTFTIGIKSLGGYRVCGLLNLKTKEQMKEEEKRALQSINETPAQKVAKRRKLNEEVEDLKIHLEIVLDEDDDIYTGATPLARKKINADVKIIDANVILMLTRQS